MQFFGILIRQLQGNPSVAGQIIATSHDLGPQTVAKEGKSPYFRIFQVGESVHNEISYGF